MRRTWELLRLALSSLRRTPLRVSLTALGVAIATGSLVSMVGFALGVQERVEEPFHRMELFNRIDVTPRRESGFGSRSGRGENNSAQQSDPKTPPVPLDASAVARLAALPGVVLAYPDCRLESVQVVQGAGTKTASALGLPARAARLRFVAEALLAGRFFNESADDEVVLGRKLSATLGFASPEEALGRSLHLKIKGLVPAANRTYRFEERELDVVVVGVWNPPSGRHGFSSDGIVLPTECIQELPGVQYDSGLERFLGSGHDPSLGFGRVVVRVAHPGDLFLVEKRIQEMGFEGRSLLSQFKEMQTGFIIMDLLLTAVGGVALVVAGLGIINTLLMAVLERYREIGIYRALGASDGDLRLLFLGEACLVGLLGGLGGLILGRVVSWVLEIAVNAIARSRGVDEDVVSFAFPFPLLAGAVLFSLLVSLASGVYPAVRAARVDPIRALRSE